MRKQILQKNNNVMPFFFSHSPAHKYYLTTDPITGSIYLSDTNSRRIYKIKSTTSVKDIVKNAEVLAGTGDQCLPFDDTRCGDGGKGTDATLTNPRGENNSSSQAFFQGVYLRGACVVMLESTLLSNAENTLGFCKPSPVSPQTHPKCLPLEISGYVPPSATSSY